jgi:hypothetical protein
MCGSARQVPGVDASFSRLLSFRRPGPPVSRLDRKTMPTLSFVDTDGLDPGNDPGRDRWVASGSGGRTKLRLRVPGGWILSVVSGMAR